MEVVYSFAIIAAARCGSFCTAQVMSSDFIILTGSASRPLTA